MDALLDKYRPCGEILTDPDGFTARCMVGHGFEHSHHDMTARESVTAGNQVIDGRGVIFDADGYPLARYIAHAPDNHDSDPHVYDETRGEVVEALLTAEEALGRAIELTNDPSTDPREAD